MPETEDWLEGYLEQRIVELDGLIDRAVQRRETTNADKYHARSSELKRLRRALNERK